LRWLVLGALGVNLGCGQDLVLAMPVGPKVQRDGWLDTSEVVRGDGASSFVSELPTNYNYYQPDRMGTRELSRGKAFAGLPRAVLEDSRIYSVSLYAGLVVTDVSDPLTPRITGRYPVEGEPVGLSVQGGVVQMLVNEPSELNTVPAPREPCGDRMCNVPQRSRLISLDAREPGNIRSVGEDALSGTATAGHRLGSMLYVLTQDFDTCYECIFGGERQGLLTAYDVSDPLAVVRTGELPFPDAGLRSYSFSPERLYVVEHRFGTTEPELVVVELDASDRVPVPLASIVLAARSLSGAPVSTNASSRSAGSCTSRAPRATTCPSTSWRGVQLPSSSRCRCPSSRTRAAHRSWWHGLTVRV
jgi:hypothetical protein